MCEQQAIPIERVFEPISFQLHGCDYRILHDDSRGRHQPKWYVQRMTDMRITERFYQWPDGAFSSVFWGRAKWID